MTNIRNAFSAAIGLTLLGSSLFLGAGAASAATCPAGQHWNEMGGGSGFCSPDASGGGTGGGGVYTDPNYKAPESPQAPVFNPPLPYKPPVYGPAPAPVVPRPAEPAPVPIQQIPAPAQNHAQIPAPAVQDRPSNNVAEVARNQASTHDAVVTEASKNMDAATENKPEAKSVDKTDNKKLGAKSSSPESAKVTAEATSTPSPSVSEAASPSEIDAEEASAVEPIMNAVLVIFCVGVLSYLTWGLVIKPRLNRKPSKTDESWSE